jgi:hypothetical protein
MRRVTLDEINSALGVTLTAEMISTTLNVAQCDDQGRFSSDSGMWDADDFLAIKHRLIQYLDYRTPDAMPQPPQSFIAGFF